MVKIPCAPSPQYLEHLLKQNICKITFIGTSGCGKSEISKKFSSFSDQYNSFSGCNLDLDFDVLSVDLSIGDTLVPRIKKDFHKWFSMSLSKYQHDAFDNFLESAQLKLDDSQKLNLISSWMGNVMHCQEWYKYSSFWYTRAEEEETLSFRNVLNKGKNGVIDTTGSVFVLDKTSQNLVRENSLIVYIDSLERKDELGKRIIKDAKPISLSSLDHFNGFLEQVSTDFNHEIYSWAEDYYVDQEKIREISGAKDLKTLIHMKKGSLEDKALLGDYKEVYHPAISMILGYYYSNHEMVLRDDLYKKMGPHVTIPSSTLYDLDVPRFMDYIFSDLEATWKKIPNDGSRVPKELPKAPLRFF